MAPELLDIDRFAHSARCHFARDDGWVSPTERLAGPDHEWHAWVRAAELIRTAEEAEHSR